MLLKQQRRRNKETFEVATLTSDPDSLYAAWGKYFPNPDPTLLAKAGGKGIKLYDEVARDGHTASVLQTRYLAIIGKEWSVVPAETIKSRGRNAKETKEKKIAQFVKSVLADCNFDEMRKELLHAILFGYYGSEIIWVLKGDQIVIGQLLGKHPRRFCFTSEREPRLITVDSMIEGEEIPDKKFLIFRYGDSDNPYGKGLGQILWWYVWFKKHGIKFWMIFMEKFGMPTPLGKYPASAKAEKGVLLTALKSLQKENGIIIPEGMSIELMEAARQGDGSYQAACEYFDRTISKVVLGQTLTTEVGSTGSYAASQTHNQVRQDIVEADADLLDAFLNNTLIKWIVDYNFPGVTNYPQLRTYAEQKPDLKARSEIDKTLAADVGLPIAKSYFYETYGIPEPQEGEEIVGKAAQQLPMGSFGGQFAEGRQVSPMQRTLDNLSNAAVKQSSAARADISEYIRKIGQGCKTLMEFRDKIYGGYPDMPIKVLEQTIKDTLITARIYGRSVASMDIKDKQKKYADRNKKEVK